VALLGIVQTTFYNKPLSKLRGNHGWGTATFSLRREALSGETIRVFSGDST
jgi:hypothetical protein